MEDCLPVMPQDASKRTEEKGLWTALLSFNIESVARTICHLKPLLKFEELNWEILKAPKAHSGAEYMLSSCQCLKTPLVFPDAAGSYSCVCSSSRPSAVCYSAANSLCLSWKSL